ncbi:MAG: transporter substrate-binding domain-containing protein [Proteobacteria bacterium]|nr:transporter substrate-binding domain-containing protein [Pseudomonadota bacterium]
MKFEKYLLAMFFWLGLSATAEAQETVSIASGESGVGWSQYAKHYGYMLHITTEAFALVGIQVETSFYPWKRAFIQARAVENDATCCWFFVEERSRDFYYSDPVFEESMVFFHLKSFDFEWNTMVDLRGIPSGGNIGFHYGDDFQAAEKAGTITVQRVPNNVQNLRKLLAGRIKIFPIASITAFGHLRKMYPSKKVALFTYHPKPVLTKTLHLLLPRKMQKKRALRLLSLFNRGLKRLRETGKHDEIKKKAEMGFYRLMEIKWKP